MEKIRQWADGLGAPNWAVALGVIAIASLIISAIVAASLDGSGPARVQAFYQLALVIAGIVALPLAVWRSYTAHRQAQTSIGQLEGLNRQIALAEIGAQSDRLEKAVQMLESEKLAVRMASIAILDRLSIKENSRYHSEARGVMRAFIQDRSKTEEEKSANSGYKSPPDIASAFESYTRRRDHGETLSDNVQLHKMIFNSRTFDAYMHFHETYIACFFNDCVFSDYSLANEFSKCTFEKCTLKIDPIDFKNCEFIECKLSGKITRKFFASLKREDCDLSDLEVEADD